jgi:glycosyltransferase involved in cell wall biosynthesis
MRVLVVHNRYSSRVPSGENGMVDDEVRWLASAGVDVDRFEASNDTVVNAGAARKLTAGLNTMWSPGAAKKLRGHIERARPDLVHFHNVFPLLSPSVLSSVHAAGLPAVWTVHNYRLGCIAGTHFRDGRLCYDCTHGIPRIAGVAGSCYSDSQAASAVLTPAVLAFRSIARRFTLAITVSGFVRDWLVAQGFDPERVAVNHGAVVDPGAVGPPPSSSKRLVFVGRLSEEKGVRLLLDAFASVTDPAAQLHVIGSGDLQAAVDAAALADHRISRQGQVGRDTVIAEMARARAVVVPSLWNETFGRTAVEAMSLGRPVITTGRGGLAEVVDPGSGWRSNTQVEALASTIGEALAAPAERLDNMGRAGRARYEAQFTPEVTTRNLIGIYREALRAHAETPTPS